FLIFIYLIFSSYKKHPFTQIRMNGRFFHMSVILFFPNISVINPLNRVLIMPFPLLLTDDKHLTANVHLIVMVPLINALNRLLLCRLLGTCALLDEISLL